MKGNHILHDPLASAARMYDAAFHEPVSDETGLAQMLADIEARRQGWTPKPISDLLPITRDRFVMLARRAIRDLDVHEKERIIRAVEAEYEGESDATQEIVRNALTTLEALRCAPVPARESLDPYILLDGESFHFHSDVGGFFWNRRVPTCPACGDDMGLGRKLSGVRTDGNGSPTAIVCFCLARVAVRR